MNIHTYKAASGETVTIRYDEFSGNPRRDWLELGHLWAWHGRYDLGDKDMPREPITPEEAMAEGLIPEGSIVLGLYLYDHGGITMSFAREGNPFSDPWDSGKVGYIWMSPEEMVSEALDEEGAYSMLEATINTYDLYLTGQVYEYTVRRPCHACGKDDEFMDGCAGFYGVDSIVSHLEAEWPPAEGESVSP